MFGLDPLSRPVAIAEMLLLLAFAAFAGWLLGRLFLNSRISALRSEIADKEAELENCRQSKPNGIPVRNTQMTAAPVSTAYSEPVIDPPALFVSADPLLPAFSHDDTPDFVVDGPEFAEQVGSISEPANGYMDTSAVLPPEPVSGKIDSMPVPGTSMPGVTTPATSEAAVLDRIAARANEINFDRIGRATAAEADDLKDIIGVGPFLERKLHSLGIYTFRQVANFTKEDVDKVNSIIEFFPGRIERDNWVEQSKNFHEKKYGATS